MRARHRRILHRRLDRRLPDRDRGLLSRGRPRLCRLRQSGQGGDAGGARGDVGNGRGSERSDRPRDGRGCPRALGLRARGRGDRDRRPWRRQRGQARGIGPHRGGNPRRRDPARTPRIPRRPLRDPAGHGRGRTRSSHGCPWTRVRARDRSNKRAAASRSASQCRDGQPARDRRARRSRAAFAGSSRSTRSGTLSDLFDANARDATAACGPIWPTGRSRGWRNIAPGRRRRRRATTRCSTRSSIKPPARRSASPRTSGSTRR